MRHWVCIYLVLLGLFAASASTFSCPNADVSFGLEPDTYICPTHATGGYEYQWLQPKRRIHLDDQEDLKMLNEKLLSEYFGLSISMGDNNLIPVIFSRFIYCSFLSCLLDASKPSIPKEGRAGIDIGTGPFAIYAGIFCRLRHPHTPMARMTCTEGDNRSALRAVHTIKGWGMDISSDKQQCDKQAERSTISVVDITTLPNASGLDTIVGVVPDLFEEGEREGEREGEGEGERECVPRYSCTMCNPPFSDTAAPRNYRIDSVYTGTRDETYTPGGEVGFVRRMIGDSTVSRGQVAWYSSLVSRSQSVEQICRILSTTKHIKTAGVANIYMGITRRYVVFWSYTHSMDMAHYTPGCSIKKMEEQE
ncbi:ribosomal RNA large subunit methyltransferase F-like [Kipferlia bialata]|uniref:Ribosomal RNA large subunit methyltransferase F-like n=1 Tax=Kipferlia bialata TaxID=797122 RepID=A0A9K3CVA0_9EUKA|nr:ribosomal RNA large subunit methyltransferase F-like [Kipferlia bialata]|eukprot:g4327.t1